MEDCIRSIARFPTSGGYDLYIMHSDLLEKDETEICACAGKSMRVHFVYVKESDADFPQSERYPLQIYYRIFAAELLPASLDRILYLDSDIIIINPLFIFS